MTASGWRRLAPLAAVLAWPALAGAQGVRITGTSVAELVDLRPLVTDSIPVGAAGDTVPGSGGSLRYAPDGQIVRCAAGEAFCYFRRPTTAVAALPMLQDLEATAWGLTRGLRVYVRVRGRANIGNADLFWPQADDPFQLLAAYVELDRAGVRARVGRQWQTSPLGFYNFDGASLLWRIWRPLAVEGFAGWSLVRGLNEPQDSRQISALEPLAPDRRAYYLGGQVRWRPIPRFVVSAIYERELRTDRAGLYSERVGADARARFLGLRLDEQFLYDLAQEQINEARLRLLLPPWRRVNLTVEARRHAPFFELWTIWGAFSPVAFDEGRALVSWSAPSGALQLAVGGSRRHYENPNAGFPGLELRRDGWRFTADAAWRPGPAWSVHGAYDAEIGFGAARGDQSLAIRRLFPRNGYAGLAFQAWQQAFEFRVAEGRVVGGGAEAGFALDDAVRLDGNFYLLRHIERAPATPDWGQVRGTLRASWTLGREPGPRIPGGGVRGVGGASPAAAGVRAGVGATDTAAADTRAGVGATDTAGTHTVSAARGRP